MFENARKYVLESVLPSYQEVLDHHSSNEWGENQLLRKCIIAGTALFHLREHIPSSVRPTKKSLKDQYPDYRLVSDIANVAKHGEITQDKPRISKAGQMYEAMVLTMFEDEQGKFWAPQIEAFVRLDDGTEMKLIHVLHGVMCMWRGVLANLGIIDLAPIKPLRLDQPMTRSEASSRRARMSMTKGEEYSWEWRMRRYDYERNVSEPMDTTGMNMEFAIYEMPGQVPIRIHLTNARTEIDFDFDVPLSAEQAMEFVSLEDRNGKITFLKRVIDSNPKIKVELEGKVRSAIQVGMSKST